MYKKEKVLNQKTKFNKWSNDWIIKLINGNRSFINNGENFRKKQIALCSNLPSGILVAQSSYIGIE